MEKNKRKLTVCVLAIILGLSCGVYPVHAQETETSQQRDTEESFELDKTVVSVEETPDIEMESASEEIKTMEENEPEQFKEASNTTEQAGQPKQQGENNITPYANDTGDFTVTGGTYGVDYTYDGNLHILTSTKLTITTNGKATSSMIRGDIYGITYNLVFRNLHMNGQQNDSHVNIPGHLNLTIFDTNTIDVYGIGLTCGSLTVTADSTGSLSLNAGGSDDLWLDGYGSSNSNLEVKGGSLFYNDSDIGGTIQTSGTGKVNPAPTPEFTTTQTARSITVNLTNYRSEYGQVKYKWDNGDWGTNNILSNLGESTSHTVSVRYEGTGTGAGKYMQSEEKEVNVSTNAASYTITIPADPSVPLVAGETDSTSTISVNRKETFDLGYNGRVDVKIKGDGNISSDGKLTLTRKNDPNKHTITSALLVNGTALGDISKSIATFKNEIDNSVTVSFAQPTESNILAGTYNGTVTFEISYSEQ